MSKLGNFYRRNVYGVIGTLLFHILLVITFLLADIDMKGNIKEKELIIEFPYILPDEPEVPETNEQEQQETPDETSSQISENRSRTTNVASNRLATPDKFFDQEYLNEVEEAKRLVSDVNNQLSKKNVDIEDIKMPVETTEGMNPDSIKNIIYTGESNIIYFLEHRYHISLPIPVYLALGGGKVIVDINVNRDGVVVKAVARKNSSVRDEQIYLYAEVAASKTIFNSSPVASEIQNGTIQYTFIAQ